MACLLPTDSSLVRESHKSSTEVLELTGYAASILPHPIYSSFTQSVSKEPTPERQGGEACFGGRGIRKREQVLDIDEYLTPAVSSPSVCNVARGCA